MQDVSKLNTQLIPLAQLKLEFKEIVLNPKHRHEADQYKKWITRTLSISATDTTSNTLYSDDYRGIYTLLSREDIDALRGISVTLNSTDHLHDCIKMYIEQRKGVVNMIWRQLHQKVKFKDVQGLDYEQEHNGKIQWWIQVANIFLGHVYVTEKSFYDQIFGGLETLNDVDDYVPIIGESALNLFMFADSLVGSRKLSQRLEMLLPIYKELLDVMPLVNLLFQKDSDFAKKIQSKATEIVFKIAQCMIQILSASEHQVLHEISMSPTPGVKIHTMTEYVMRYIDLISSYKDSLTDLIAISMKDLGVADQKSPLSHHAMRIIECLLQNLRNKSNVRKNESFGQLFMINNVHYVVQSIKGSKGMQELIDKDFQTKLSKKVEQAVSDYLRTWENVFLCLDTRKSKSLSFSRILVLGQRTKHIKRKFKTFNCMFEDIVQTHKQWVVQDQKLREELQESILNKLIPAYTCFLEEYSCDVAKVQHPERYLKYSVKDLEHIILNLFECYLSARINLKLNNGSFSTCSPDRAGGWIPWCVKLRFMHCFCIK